MVKDMEKGRLDCICIVREADVMHVQYYFVVNNEFNIFGVGFKMSKLYLPLTSKTKKASFFCLVVFCLLQLKNLQGQDTNAHPLADTVKVKNYYKTIYFYKWGMPDFGYSDAYLKCEDSLQNKYGFRYMIVAGCVVSSGKVRKWKRHNKICEKKMVKRHGAKWREKYEQEFRNCMPKERNFY